MRVMKWGLDLIYFHGHWGGQDYEVGSFSECAQGLPFLPSTLACKVRQWRACISSVSVSWWYEGFVQREYESWNICQSLGKEAFIRSIWFADPDEKHGAIPVVGLVNISFQQVQSSAALKVMPGWSLSAGWKSSETNTGYEQKLKLSSNWGR